MNQPIPAPKAPLVRPWIWIVLAVVVIGAGGYYYFGIYQKASPQSGPTASPAITTSAKKTTPSPSSTASSYTNNTYGFTFNYPASWGACKVKEAQVTGAEATFYINCPTKDASFAAGDSLQFPGYYSPMAISAFTAAQWTANQAEETEKDTLLKQGQTHTFGWIQANGQLPNDWTNAQFNDYQTILNTFNLL